MPGFGLDGEEETEAPAEEHAFDSQEDVLRYIEESLGGSPEYSAREIDELTIDELCESVPGKLTKIGLMPSSNSTEDIEKLMARGYADYHDVENLYFEVWDDARLKLGRFARVEFEYIRERAALIDPVELEKRQNDEAALRLSELCIVGDKSKNPGNSENTWEIATDADTRNLRRLSWLLSKEPALEQYSMGLAQSAKKGQEINTSIVAENVTNRLNETRDLIKSMDVVQMDKIDMLWRKAELRRLKYVINLSESVLEGFRRTSE